MRFHREILGLVCVVACASCGEGLRIGIIDGVVDIEHPAPMGQRIVYRSFVKERRKPGASAYCWHSWDEQIESTRKLEVLTGVKWVFSGHGKWFPVPPGDFKTVIGERVRTMVAERWSGL